MQFIFVFFDITKLLNSGEEILISGKLSELVT